MKKENASTKANWTLIFVHFLQQKHLNSQLFLFQRFHQRDVEHEAKTQAEFLEKLKRLIIDRTSQNHWILNLRADWLFERNQINEQIKVYKIWFEHTARW